MNDAVVDADVAQRIPPRGECAATAEPADQREGRGDRDEGADEAAGGARGVGSHRRQAYGARCAAGTARLWRSRCGSVAAARVPVG